MSVGRQRLTGLRTLGLGHEILENPRGLALRFMRHYGMLASRDADDVLSDALLGLAKALELYDPGNERCTNFAQWCWWKMRSEVSTGRRRRSRLFHREVVTDWDDPDTDAYRIDVVEHGYKQVEDRVTLQRWADMAHLSDFQADLIAWLAVHEGTVIRHTSLRGEPSPLTGKTTVLKSALSRLRRVAVTGKAFVRIQPAPQFSLEDVRQAVAG